MSDDGIISIVCGSAGTAAIVRHDLVAIDQAFNFRSRCKVNIQSGSIPSSSVVIDTTDSGFELASDLAVLEYRVGDITVDAKRDGMTHDLSADPKDCSDRNSLS